ncbi:MAG: UDP-N-acetylmuramoyl-L-alanine--D-glutamate ligase [Rhizobiaceae bacterium]
MIPATTLRGRRVALFGLGGSGLATARALAEGGADVTAWDDNPDSVAKATAAGVATADLRGADWSSFAAFVLSPGVPLTHPKPHWSVDLARAADVEIIGDVELFCRERRRHAPDAPFIAITGTNGKSTTTALTAHVLASAGRDTQMGGNIGRAVMTLDPPTPTRHYVVECSSYQIDLAPSLDPSAGILLNLTPDHLDRHGTMQRYAGIKERLAAGSGTAIVGVDDVHCAQIADRLEKAGKAVVRISKRLPLADGLFADGARLVRARGGHPETVATLEGIGSLRGLHNAQNALAAAAACIEAGLTAAEIQSGLRSFPGLAHRMEQVGRKGHVLFVNDSKATNAEAAAPALSSFPRVYWIAGGLPKEGGIETLRGFFPRIARAYLIGEAAPAFSATLGEAVPYEISGTLAAAVEHAAADAAKDGSGEAVVLLSPACASFDQFRNFEMRGEAFRQAVTAIPGLEPIGGSHAQPS